jgi:hypothetical protein
VKKVRFFLIAISNEAGGTILEGIWLEKVFINGWVQRLEPYLYKKVLL